MPDTHRRYGSLDAIRGLSALGVMWFHYRAHFGAAPFERWLSPVYSSGMYLVDVFFVLSGYLLATVYGERRDFIGLAWARIARLAPLHVATLLLVAGLQYCYVNRHGGPFIYTANDARHFVLNLLMLNASGLQGNFSFNGPAWSISVEWLTNLMLFAVLACWPRRLFAIAAGLSILSMAALWMHTGHLLSYGSFKGWLDANLLRGMVGFFAGVSVAFLAPLSAQPGRMAGHAWDAVFLVAAAGVVFFLGSTHGWSQLAGVDFAFVLVWVPLLVVSACRGRRVSTLLDAVLLRRLGEISFSVYLLHFPMQLLFVLVFASPGNALDYGSTPVFLAYTASTLVVSWFAWRLLEIPAQAWLNRLWRQRSQAGRMSGASNDE